MIPSQRRNFHEYIKKTIHNEGMCLKRDRQLHQKNENILNNK